MAKRAQTIEIYAPTEGRKHDAPTTMLDSRAMPDSLNSIMMYGSNQKDFGTSIYCTGTTPTVTSGASLIFDCKFPTSSVLQIVTPTNVFKYTAGSDSFVSDGQTFTGGQNNVWNGYMYNDQFYYTNYSDPIQNKSSVSATGTNWVSAISPTTYKAYCIGALGEHLNLYHVSENGTEYYKRVRWTTKGIMPATTAFGTGLAGAIDLVDMEGELKTAVPLGITNAIYGERSIHIQNWVGGSTVYQFVKNISGIGTPSRRGVLSIGDVNYVLGQNNFYEYYGGTDLRPIGDPIAKYAFNFINRTSLNLAFVSYEPVDDEVYFHVPVNSDTHPTVAWVYKRDNKTWTYRERPYTAKGSTTRTNSITIGDLVGSIGQQNYLIGDTLLREGSEIAIYTDPTGYVVKRDRTIFSVQVGTTSTPQIYKYVTPDLTGISPINKQYADPYDQDKMDYSNKNKRWIKYNTELNGSGYVNLAYSIDFGLSYIPFAASPIQLTGGTVFLQLDIDESSKQIRYRTMTTGTNDTIAVTYAATEFIPGSVN